MPKQTRISAAPATTLITAIAMTAPIKGKPKDEAHNASTTINPSQAETIQIAATIPHVIIHMSAKLARRVSNDISSRKLKNAERADINALENSPSAPAVGGGLFSETSSLCAGVSSAGVQ